MGIEIGTTHIDTKYKAGDRVYYRGNGEPGTVVDVTADPHPNGGETYIVHYAVEFGDKYTGLYLAGQLGKIGKPGVT